MDENIVKAVKCLKERKEFHKLLDAMKDKYLRLGRLTGKVEVTNLTLEESQFLSNFNGDLDIYGAKSAKVSINKFIDYFTKGRFEGIDFIEVFLCYYDGKLVTNRDKRIAAKEKKENYFNDILRNVYEPKVQLWLNYVLEYKKYGYNVILNQYNEDKLLLKEILSNIEKGVEFIPFNDEEGIALPILSSKTTKDSHYFDINRASGKLILQFLAFCKDKTMNYSLEEVNSILSQCGIIRDEISNSTITAGLFCYDDIGEIEGYKWFRTEFEPVSISLQNLKRIQSISGRNKKVFVFENPTSFYEILNTCKGLRPGIICVSGQPNTSTYNILDKLAESGTDMLYSGDFDPEGIVICDNLKRRYGNNLKFMCMGIDEYNKIKSKNSFKDRISKLDNIGSEELIPLVEKMRDEEMGGYQELLTDEYVEFIEDTLKIT